MNNIPDKYMKKFEALMGEMGEEMIGTEEMALLEKKYREVFSREGIPFNAVSLKAMYEGMSLAITAMVGEGKDGISLATTMLLATRSMIARKDKVTKETADKALSENGNSQA